MFIKNVSITFVTRILSLLIGIGTSVIIARVLGPEGQGIYSLAILLPLIILTFTNLGIGRSTIYHIGKDTNAFKDLVGAILGSSFVISIASMFIGLIIVLFFSNSILPGVPQIFLLLALLLIPFQLFSSQSLSGILLGIQKIKEYNLVAIIQSLFMLALAAFFLIGLNWGIAGAITANLLSLLFATLLAFFWVSRSLENRHFSFQINKNILRSLLSFGYKAHLSNVFAFLHLRIDQVMLNFFLNPMTVGFYVISVNIVEKLWLLSQAVSTVLYPKVASMKDEEQRKRLTPLVARNTLLITMLGAFVVFLLAKWLILLLYSEKYLPSVEPLQVLLIGIVAISIERIIANDIDARGKPMINTYITLVALIANITLNVIFIPKYGVIGAGWATSLTYALNSVIKILVYCKLSGNFVSDVILFKKSDIKLYLDALTTVNDKVKHKLNFYAER